ncbi:uncharacterized protein LOC134775078 isoform X2 [Penaeus indicus]|uniref:uncharacterized protein LOC134775078 isoform X2 n=1 Tax=Penaeus indicus TaxID=29960 RepID=UPI00300BFCC5
MALISAEPTIFMYMASYGILIILSQEFILSRLCFEQIGDPDCGNSSAHSASSQTSPTSFTSPLHLYPNPEEEWTPLGVTADQNSRVREVQEEAVRLYMGATITLSITSILSSQFLGHWMDRCSKKVLMIAPVVCMIVWALGIVFLATFPQLPIYLIFIAIAIGNISGGYVTLKSAVTSYVIQKSSESQRTVRLSMLEAAIFLGGAVGLLSLPFLTDYLGATHAMLFLGAEGLAVINFLYIIFILPDDGGPPQRSNVGEAEVIAPGESLPRDHNFGSFQGARHSVLSLGSHITASRHTVADIVVTFPEGEDCGDCPNLPASPGGGESRYGTPPELTVKPESPDNHSSYGTSTPDMFSQETYLRARHALSAALGIVTSVAGISNPASRYGTPPEYPSDLQYVPSDFSEDVGRSRSPISVQQRSAKIGEVKTGVVKGVSMRDDFLTLRLGERVGFEQTVDEVDSEDLHKIQEAPNNSDQAPEIIAVTQSFCLTCDSSHDSEDHHSHCADSCISDVSRPCIDHCHSDDWLGDDHYPDGDHCRYDDPDRDYRHSDACDGQVIPCIFTKHRPQRPASTVSLYHEANAKEEKEFEKLKEDERDTAITRAKGDKGGRKDGDLDHDGIFGRLLDALVTTFRYRPNGIRSMVIASVIANFFISFVVPAETDVIFMYVKAKLGWSFTSYATFFALKCGVDGVALLLLLPLLRRYLGLRNASLGVLGGLSRATYFIVLGSAYKPSMVFGGKLRSSGDCCLRTISVRKRPCYHVKPRRRK